VQGMGSCGVWLAVIGLCQCCPDWAFGICTRVWRELRMDGDWLSTAAIVQIIGFRLVRVIMVMRGIFQLDHDNRSAAPLRW